MEATGDPRQWAVAAMCPAVSKCVQSVSKMVEQGLELHAKGNAVELEARLGTVAAGGGFKPTIPRATWHAIRDKLSNCECWLKELPVRDVVDYYHSTAGGRTIRTRVIPAAEADEDRVSHVHKVNHHTETFVPYNQTTGAPDPHVPCVRVSLSTENEATPPPVVRATHVRITQRVEWLYDAHKETDIWSYVLYREWSGPDKAQAEQNQLTQAPLYSCEVELRKIGDYCGRNLRTPPHTATSLVNKAVELLDASGSVWYEPVHR
jgi:hypothetical protein